MRTTSMGYLPGQFCTAFDRKVFCSWKGNPGCTLLFFFIDDLQDPELPDGHLRDLACLEFNYVVNDTAEAKVLAEDSWQKYRSQILAVNGDRLYVVGDKLEG